ncbi:MAG TPA: hypothetical protein VFU29_08405 [Chitinophagaceae bacterium]|nr:hypothetical protein [Chitinophagaceae bacterium]
MKQKLSAILILVVFLSLQYGKIATYLYCKWQAEIVQNKPDCGCEDHLTSMFDHNGDDSSDNSLLKNTLTEKLNEFTPKTIIEVPQIIPSSSDGFTEYNADLSKCFIGTPFHPPIA